MIKVLFVGCGDISNPWVTYSLSRNDVKIAGIVELNRKRAEDSQKRHNYSCPIFDNLDEGLEKVKPDIVYDLTYVTVHHKIVTKALKAGCTVFGEKPMCIAREEAKNMIKTAEETGLTYSVMQNRRYQKPVQALKELVQSGKLGKIWMISADIFVGEDLASIRNSLEYPMLQDNAIHSFDQARFIIGEDPVTVYCHSYNPPFSKYKGDAAGTCIFEMSKGAVFVYNCVMGTDGCRTSWESSWRIIGSKGSAIWDGNGEPYAEYITEINGEKKLEKITPVTDWNGKFQHLGCLEEMFTAYLAKRPSETDCHDNYKSISMVFSSLDSMKLQKKIKVE
jgi:predicted dehydrogenase